MAKMKNAELKPKKKKTGLIIVGVVVAIGIIGAAAGGNDDKKVKGDDSSKKSVVADSGDKQKEEKTKTTIEEQVLWDVDGVKITATGLDEDSIWGTQVKVLVENNSDKDIGISTDAVIVNDFMISDLTSMTVTAGNKSNENITLFSTGLNAAGIENIGKIEMYMHTFDPESYQTIDKSDCITISTSDADKADSTANIDGTTLYEKDGIKIVGQYVDENSFWGSAVLVYIENNSDKNIIVQTDDIAVNGYMITGIMSSTVYSGKKTFDSITLLSSSLEENGITSIDDIETNFKILDENFSTIDESGKVKFSVK